MSLDPQDLDPLALDVQAMQWEQVSIEPNPEEVEQLDQELPAEWTQMREQELDAEYTPDELDDLLHTELDPEFFEGDIDQNAELALDQLEIDLNEIAQERDLDLELDIELEQDVDFGR